MTASERRHLSSSRPSPRTAARPAFAVAGMVLAAALCGCATPKATVDEARQSSALMQQMQQELDALTRAQQAAAERRIARLDALRALQAQAEATHELDAGIMDAAGMAGRARLVAAVQALLATQTQLDARLKAESDALDDASDLWLAAVPDTQASVSKAEADLVPLARQASLVDRAKFLKNYVQAVRADMAQSHAAAVAAAASAAAVAASTALPGS